MDWCIDDYADFFFPLINHSVERSGNLSIFPEEFTAHAKVGTTLLKIT